RSPQTFADYYNRSGIGFVFVVAENATIQRADAQHAERTGTDTRRCNASGAIITAGGCVKWSNINSRRDIRPDIHERPLRTAVIQKRRVGLIDMRGAGNLQRM